MSDLISRSALIEELKDCLDEESIQHTLEYFGVYDIIRSQPTVEAKPIVCGEWLEYPSALYRKCSACKMEFEKQKVQSSNFCPNCGADIRKKVE